MQKIANIVIPAKAGIQRFCQFRMPSFDGMTVRKVLFHRIPELVLLFCFLATLPSILLAASPKFEAEVSTKIMMQNTSLLLTLKLFNATAVTDPDTAPLEPYFDIQASSKAESVQWSDTAPVVVTRWQYQLLPKRMGKLTIPTLTLTTDNGVVKSQPVYIEVTQADKNTKSIQRVDNEAADIKIAAYAGSEEPYVGEAILLQIVVYRGSNILQTYLDKPAAANAKIEPIGEPENKTTYDGDNRWMRSIFRFALTPLQSGEIVMKPVAISGTSYGKIVRGKMGNQFYDPANDPFATFNNMLGNSRQVLDFKKASSSIKFDVKPIPSSWQHSASWWLPAQYITMSQQFSGNNVRAGESIKRNIRIDMLGASASALDNIEERLQAGLNANKWKIYVDKPNIKTVYDEQYKMLKTTFSVDVSYVPNESGAYDIPAFSLPWWSVREDGQYAAQVPAQRIEVSANFGLNRNVEPEATQANTPEPQNGMKMWLFISFMAVTTFGALYWWWLKNKQTLIELMKQGKPNAAPWVGAVGAMKSAIPEKQKAYATIMTASDPRHIINAVEAYLREIFKLPLTMRLPERAEWIGKFLDSADAAELKQLCHELESASYGGGRIEVKEWKRKFFSLLGKAEKKYKHSGNDNLTPPPLNP